MKSARPALADSPGRARCPAAHASNPAWDGRRPGAACGHAASRSTRHTGRSRSPPARLDPHRVRVIGDDVGLPVKLGEPEAVHDIDGLQAEQGRAPDAPFSLTGGATRWRSRSPGRVAKLPPPLVTDHGDAEGVRGTGPLDLEDRPRGGQKQHQDDQHRDDRPGHSMALLPYTCGGSPSSTRRGAKAHDDVDQKVGDDREDHGADGQHQPGEIADHEGRRGHRREDAGNRKVGRRHGSPPPPRCRRLMNQGLSKANRDDRAHRSLDL